ncbi:MAG: MAPEG family protein [Pseudomonadota bacterium]
MSDTVLFVPITGLYVGLTILLAIGLGMRVGLMRGSSGISIHDGGNQELALRVRHHGNLLETAALTLLALGILELNGTSPWVLHTLGLAFITARILHPIGLKADDITHPLRAVGAAGSTLVMLTAGLIAIWQFVSQAL